MAANPILFLREPTTISGACDSVLMACIHVAHRLQQHRRVRPSRREIEFVCLQTQKHQIDVRPQACATGWQRLLKTIIILLRNQCAWLSVSWHGSQAPRFFASEVNG